MRGLFGNFSWILVGNIFSTILRALTLILLVRLAVPADFALYAGFFGIFTFGKAAFDLGLTKFIIRDRSLDMHSHQYGHALRLNTVTSALFGGVATIILIVAALVITPVVWLLLPMGITAALEKNADTWRSVHLADGRAHLLALFTLARRVITLVLFGAVVFGSTLGPILSMTVAEFVAALITMLIVRKSTQSVIWLPQKINLRATLSKSRHFWAHSLAMHSRNLDVSLVGFFAPATQAGYFAAATRLTGPLQLIPSAMASVLLPHTARTHASGDIRVGKTIGAMSLGFTLICGVLALALPELVPIVLGHEYQSAVFSIQIIVLGIPLSVYANLVSAALQGEGFAKSVSRMSWAYALTLLLAVGTGAHIGGADGAALGTLIANGILASLVAYLWVRTRKIVVGTHDKYTAC